MRSSIFAAAAFVAYAAAAPAVSEYTDGQPQVTSTLTTTSPYTNAFTSYLTETNSLGVVTGQPSVITSQPSVVTSQPAVVTSQPAVVTTKPTVPGVSVGTISSAAGAGKNTTVTTSSPKTTTVLSTTPSGTVTAAAGATTTAATAAGSMIKPAVGLGLVGAIFGMLL